VLKSVRDLIIRIAKENIGWGMRRIVGELKKLGLRPGRSTIRRLLIDEGVLPDPNRPKAWSRRGVRLSKAIWNR
jgi:putative transposase